MSISNNRPVCALVGLGLGWTKLDCLSYFCGGVKLVALEFGPWSERLSSEGGGSSGASGGV